MTPARTSRATHDVAVALGIDLAPQPRSQWKGKLLHTTSEPDESYFMRAAIGMAGGALEGAARLSPNPKDERYVEADLCGAVEGREVSFTVWIRTGQEPEPFTCTGTLYACGNVMRGKWRHPCYQGGGCNCEGGGGIFELHRIRD